MVGRKVLLSGVCKFSVVERRSSGILREGNSMSDSERRPCPRCDNTVVAERLDGDDGITWLWRCPCGWAGARTGGDELLRPGSGVVSRREVSTEIARVFAGQRSKKS